MTDVVKLPEPRRPWLSKQSLRGIRVPIALLLLWQVSSELGWIDHRFLPPLQEIFRAGWRELVSGDLVYHIGASLTRNISGFVLGTLIGIAFGSLLGLSRVANRLVGPSFNGIKQIAVLAWIPIISVWFGFAESAKIAFITLAAFLPVALNTIEGMQSSPSQILEVGRSLRFTRFQQFRLVQLPSAMPSILTGVHLALIYSWLATVGAEYFMSVGPGIGGLIISGRERFEMDIVMLGVLILGIIGYALNKIAELAERRLLRWRDG